MFGGHGYIEEWGMSQFVRDARIAMIYEGANGIQAMDLVGRKLGKDGGRAVMAFFNEVGAFCQENANDENLKGFVAPLQQGLGHLQQATMWFMQNAMAKPDNAGAGATDYMHLFGLVAMGYMWAKMAKAAQGKKAEGNGVADKMDAKLVTGRFFMERMMPETGMRLARISTGGDTVMAMPGGGVLDSTLPLAGRVAGEASAGGGWRRRHLSIPHPPPSPPRKGEGSSGDPHARRLHLRRRAHPRGRGKPDGSLHEVATVDLAVTALDACAAATASTPSTSRTWSGLRRPVGEAGGDIARAAVLKPASARIRPGVQINRFCASGLDAVNLAAAQVMTGMKDVAIGGGVESMSRVGMAASGAPGRSIPGIAIPNYFLPQGISADLIATKYGFTRDDVDAYAVESQRRAARAWEEGASRNPSSPSGRQRPHAPRPRRAHAAPDRHAVARPAQTRLRPDGRDGRLRRGRDRGASGRGGDRPRPPRRQLVGASWTGPRRCWSARGGRRQDRGQARARIRSFASMGSDLALMLTGPHRRVGAGPAQGRHDQGRHRSLRDQRGLLGRGAALHAGPRSRPPRGST
jgi:acetyl-CoA acetyltransferase